MALHVSEVGVVFASPLIFLRLGIRFLSSWMVGVLNWAVYT